MNRLCRLTLLLSLLLPCIEAEGLEYGRIEALEGMDYVSVYSVAQDSLGAIWINCNYGLCRFNGHSLTYVHSSMPMHSILVADGRYVYAPSSRSIFCWDALEGHGREIRGPVGADWSSCAMAMSGSRFYAGIGNVVYVAEGDSMTVSVTLEPGHDISSMLSRHDRSLLLAFADGRISILGRDGLARDVAKAQGRVRSMFEDSDGNVWAGLYSGGALRYSPDFRECKSWPLPLREIRTFAEAGDGAVYAGSVDGIVSFRPDGSCVVEPAASPGAHPICSLFTDRDGHLWVGTYYDGVYYCTGGSSPFSMLDYRQEQSIRIVTDVVQDRRGELWVMTDSYGMYRTAGSRWMRIDGTEKFKIKSAWYDASSDIIWIGRYMAPLLAYHIPSGSMMEYPFLGADGAEVLTSANDIVSLGDELFIATLTSGLWRFSPGREISVSRKVGSDTEVLYCLAVDAEGTLWAGGKGFLRLKDGRLTRYGVGESMMCVDLCCDDSAVWVATAGHGFFSVQGDSLSFYDKANSGITGDNVSVIASIGGGRILAGCRSDVSICDVLGRRSLNFSRKNGLNIGSVREGCATPLSDGRWLLGGVDGVQVFDGSAVDFGSVRPGIRFDRIRVNNGEWQFVSGDSDEMTVEAGCRSLSFDVASFDYDGSLSVRYEYCTDAMDGEWHSFDPKEPLTFNNVRHGRYAFSVRVIAPGEPGELIDSCRLGLVLRPEWYETRIFRVLLVLLLIALATVVLVVVYDRLLLMQRLKVQQEENDRRTKFFIRVSHELRTPLTLVIGQLELFLQRAGNSGVGSGNVSRAYNGAKEMKDIISGFVGMEDRDALPSMEDLPTEEEIREMRPQLQQAEAPSVAYTMLIADDNAEMRSLLRSVFSQEYKLLEAVGGEDALELARTRQPDIIVSDVMMPGMDGLTLCARLRADFETCHIPVVLITAHASEKSNLKGMVSGADDYIAKPFSVEILRARCRNLLETRKMLMNKYSLAPSADTSEREASVFLNAAIGAVERHLYSDDLNVSTIASELAMSKTTLNNRLVATCGFSTRDFIEDIRLRHSVKFLQEGKRVSEVADMLGFSSAKYFTIRFKRKYGASPSEYLKGR